MPPGSSARLIKAGAVTHHHLAPFSVVFTARAHPYFATLTIVMTQAGVDLALNGDDGEPCPKRRCSGNEDDDEGSSLDEDPSWRPSEGGSRKQKKQKRRRQRRRSHGEQCTAVDASFGTLLCGVSPGPSTSSGTAESFSRPLSTSVSVELTEDCDEAWEDFRPLGTEMIICKEGR